MKRLIVPVVLVACLAALAAGGVAAAKGSGGAKGGSARYLVISPHSPEECLKALDEVSAMGANTLKMYDWGCKNGDHTGYLIINAASEQEALSKVPASIRDKAKAVKLDKFTSDEIKKIHESMEKKS